MKNFALFILVCLTLPQAHARNVQKPECIGPANAPVKAVYLHGWFPRSGDGSYVNLERMNRVKLEELAAKLNIRIAVPVATTFNPRNGNREWQGNPQGALKSIENSVTSVCGVAPATPRALIGFSAGGYMARNIALACDDKLKKQYSDVVMIGAKPRNPSGGAKRFAGCPKFTFMSGTSDRSTNASQAPAMKNAYERLGGRGEVVSYPGGHVLPSASLLEKQLKSLQSSPAGSQKSDASSSQKQMAPSVQ